MRLTHWSAEALPVLENREQEYAHTSEYAKPNGFWLSDESAEMSWSTWCEENDFRRDRLTTRIEFEVDMTNVLHLKTPSELREFAAHYNYPYRWGSYVDYPIRWQNVAKDYKGILITPYQWECRLAEQTLTWYYPWDCASGCFWDVSCLTRINEGVEVDAMDR